MVCVLFLVIAALFVGAAAFFATKHFVRDVYIIVRGRRYTGVCTGKCGFRMCEHRVEWTDSEGVPNLSLFSVTTFRKPPFELPVYSVDNDPKKSNLGLRSIIYYLPVLVLTDFTFLALIFGAIPEYLKLL